MKHLLKYDLQHSFNVIKPDSDGEPVLHDSSNFTTVNLFASSSKVTADKVAASNLFYRTRITGQEREMLCDSMAWSEEVLVANMSNKLSSKVLELQAKYEADPQDRSYSAVF